MILVVMGVSGAGKSTLGWALADSLGWTFVEGDHFHPAANIEKMCKGMPLDDGDRVPWLQALNDHLQQLDNTQVQAVVACSALKPGYRELLARGIDDMRYVYLHGDPLLIRQRIAGRKEHFMPAELLDSQIAAMQPPQDGIPVDIDLTLDQQVRRVRRAIAAE